MGLSVRQATALPIRNVDRNGHELNVGDRVGFVMRGWFQPREQESFGIITEIDSRGGIRIDVIESYRSFTSSGRVGAREKTIYYTHHIYDSAQRFRVYSKQEGEHLLSLFRVESDELERRLREAKEAEARKSESERTSLRSQNRRGR